MINDMTAQDPSLPELFVVIEGPSCGDAEFISCWLASAIEADGILRPYLLQNPDFKKQIICIEAAYLVAFTPAALAFVRKWFRAMGAFSIYLRSSQWSDMLAIMTDVGFFTKTGARYQMTVPKTLEIETITKALLRLASTEDDEYYLHHEMHLTTMNPQEAAAWESRLNQMPFAQRVADRNYLLEDHLDQGRSPSMTIIIE